MGNTMPKSYVDEPRPAPDGSEDTATKVKNKVVETASKAKEKIEEVGRTVQDKIDDTRVPAADKLQNVASTLHEKADTLPGGETVSGLAHSAADKMQATADYVRQHDSN